jgi:hypothetical protein
MAQSFCVPGTTGTTFLEFFQSIRGGGKKGIVRIDLAIDLPEREK